MSQFVASHQQMNPHTPLLPRLAISLALAALILPACDWQGIRGNGDITTENRTIADFSTIEVSGAFKINWSPGSPALALTADHNLLGEITTEVKDGKLRIRTRERIRPTRAIRVVLSSQTLTGSRLRGAVDLKASKIMAPNFFLEADGASDVILEGTVENLNARLRGAGDLLADSLQAKVVEVSIMGAADAKVTATESLSASIKGAGDIRYGGNPQSVKKSVAGAGSVRPIQ
jgi:hypothetical protein